MAKSSVSMQESNGRVFRLTETGATKDAADEQLVNRVAFTVGTIVPDSYSSSSGENAPAFAPAGGPYSDVTIETVQKVTLNLENVQNTFGNATTGEIVNPAPPALVTYLTSRGLTFKEGRFRR